MKETPLDSGWTFTQRVRDLGYTQNAVQAQEWLQATVPGYVHLDLVANGIVQDPFYGMGELGVRWVDESDWSYRASFDWAPDGRLPKRELRFEGLDTVCRVYLNGQQIAAHDNMFVPVEIDVTDILRDGSNELLVEFDSAVRVGQERRARYFESEGLPVNTANFDERSFVRKAQYMSAWDWGPRLVSCGIWQPVKLREYAARIVSFEVLQKRLPDGRFHVWSETVTEGEGELTLTFDDQTITSSSSSKVEIDLVVEDPVLWWPSGMGEPDLYRATAKLGEQIVPRKIGLRTIELRREPDQFGESFEIVVNGRPTWIRGANWIPNDSFPSRVTRSDYQSQVGTALYLGINMLRVWGGGLYELDDFYDACDLMGVLVWQDFAFACSYYPDDSAALDVVSREAEHQIRRLRSRASLALWCGNNENHMMWVHKWGGDRNPSRYYGETIYNDLLPKLLDRLDPLMPYIESSPIGPAENPKAHVNDGGSGDSHYWNVWHGQGDWNFYRDSTARFSSEFGFASAPSLAQWEACLPDPHEPPDGSTVRWHDKTGKGWEKFRSYVELHYPASETLEDWTYYSQLNQRDALRFGIEHYRRSAFCKGVLIWQFNDCWPVQSWAVQDGLRLLKPAGYELSRLYADWLLSIDGGTVYGINDHTEPWSAELKVEVLALADGSAVLSASETFELAVGERRALWSLPAGGWDPAQHILCASTNSGCRTISTLAEPKDLQLGPILFKVADTGERVAITVTGVAVDLVVWDPDDAFNLLPLNIGVPGVMAQTVINETVQFGYRKPPERVMLRSLAGVQEIALWAI